MLSNMGPDRPAGRVCTFKTDYPDFCAMMPPMEIDSYWRTRCVGEAMDQGYSHLRAVCSGCGRITDIPWLLMLRRPGIRRDTFIGNLPLRCQRCGNTTPIIGVKIHGYTQG